MHFAFLRDLKQHGCQTLSPCAFYNMGFLFHLAAAAVLFSPTPSFPSLLWLQIISVTSLTATGESWWVFTLHGYCSISCGFIQRENYLSSGLFILSLFLEPHWQQILRVHRWRQTIFKCHSVLWRYGRPAQCFSGTFGDIYAACGHHEIQYKEKCIMNRYKNFYNFFLYIVCNKIRWRC